MSNLREGFRRTAVVVGACGVLAWGVFVLYVTAQEGPPRGRDWIVVVFGAALAFFAPWAIVRGIGWAVEGFRGRR